jgi:O-acetylhomoserine (thiol)-lyase
MVDNTFATPYLCRPIEHGADIVVHSATKFIGGHGVAIGGVIVESGNFPYDNGKFPILVEPSPAYHDLQFWENFREYAYLTRARVELVRDIGAARHRSTASSSSSAWRPCAADAPARRERRIVATHLATTRRWHGSASRSSTTTPTHRWPASTCRKGPGAVFTFGLNGGYEAGVRFIEGVELASHLANVGDAKTLVIHPASTTHQQVPTDERVAAGLATT